MLKMLGLLCFVIGGAVGGALVYAVMLWRIERRMGQEWVLAARRRAL